MNTTETIHAVPICPTHQIRLKDVFHAKESVFAGICPSNNTYVIWKIEWDGFYNFYPRHVRVS